MSPRHARPDLPAGEPSPQAPLSHEAARHSHAADGPQSPAASGFDQVGQLPGPPAPAPSGFDQVGQLPGPQAPAASGFDQVGQVPGPPAPDDLGSATPDHLRPQDGAARSDAPGAAESSAEPGALEPGGPETPAAAAELPVDSPPASGDPVSQAGPPGSAGAGMGSGGRSSRARRLVLIGLLVVAGVMVLALAASSLGGPDGAQPAPTATPTVSPTQRTLLIQVRNDADVGADNMIAGVGGGLPPAQVLVPSRLIVDVPGAGQMTLGRSAQQLDRSASQDALSDLLSLRVDGTLSLGRLALAGMVDYVGGISLTIDKEITIEDPKTGDQVVAVPQGTAHLNGTQAATYALAWLPDEPEAARLARFSDVMTATISELPDDELRVEAMLTSLGGQARTTTTTSAVADFLVEMRAALLEGGQQVRVLPVTDIDAVGSVPVVRVDIQAADAMLSNLLPQAVLSGEDSQARVLVQNGVGTPGLGASARDKLVANKLVYINGGNADSFGRQLSSIIVADESASAQAQGEQVAAALGLPVSAIEVAASGQNLADVVVILGADFQP